MNPLLFSGPIFEAMAGEFPGVEFLKVDVDEAEDVAAQCGIQAMPTFQVYKGGEKVGKIRCYYNLLMPLYTHLMLFRRDRWKK